MGVIQRQSLKFTIINFFGTFIGFLSVVFIYSLNKELYGYFQFLYSNASLLLPILGFGIHGAIIKYAPIFENKGESKQFFVFSLALTTICAILSTLFISILYYLFYPLFGTLFKNFQAIDDNKFIILTLGIIFLYSTLFVFQAISRYRIVIPDLINTVGLKFFLPILILLFHFEFISRNGFIYTVIIYFIIIAFVLFFYVVSLGKHDIKPKLDILNKEEYKGLFGFMYYSSLNSLGSNFALRMDVIMIGSMISYEAVGIYFIILVISNVMDIPAKAINQITGPVISKNWVDDDQQNIQDIYFKSSIYGGIIGVFLFLMIYVIWPDVILLVPKDKDGLSIELALSVFTFLGLAKIVDIITGVNTNIISYSKDYKFNMYFLLVLGVLNLGLNYLFLTKYGVVGAAIATFLSMVIYNVLKHFFVFYRFGFQLNILPIIQIIGTGILVFTVMALVDLPFHPILNMVLKVGILATIYSSIIWMVNPGHEFRGQVIQIVKNYKSFLPNIVSKYLL